MKTKILQVIVIYNIQFDDLKNKIPSHLDCIIIDNSYESLIKPKNRLKGKTNFIYVHFPNNPGLSYAYNYACEYAANKGYNWILISDQDTIFPENYYLIYEAAVKNNPQIKLFCPKVIIPNGKYLSPVPLRHFFPRFEHSVPTGIINISNFAIINTGLLINVKAYQEIGGYNNKVWLDYADFQFIERFNKYYSEGYVIDITLTQSFSNEVENIIDKINRFKKFCSSIKHYESSSYKNKIFIHLAVLKRTLSLCSQSKSLIPFRIFFKNYIL